MNPTPTPTPTRHATAHRRRAALRGLGALTALTALTALGATLWPGTAQAQPKPALRLVVGYAAGGPVDTAARLFAQSFSKELDQTVLIENRPGAGGSMGGDYVAKAPANGQVLYFGASPTMTITPHVLKSMPFDVSRDLVAVAPILSYANVLVVNKDQPFTTVAELQAYAKTRPGEVAYGSAGMGGSNHLSAELFAKRAGISLNHVPYKGNAPAMTDVIGGQINMMFDIIGTGRNYINSGRVRALAVTSRERNPALPDVPTMSEAGITDFEVGGWYGLFAPAQLPPALLQRYNQATQKVLAEPTLQAKLVEQGYEVWSGPAQLLSERAARELTLWGTVTQGIQFE